MRLSFYKGKNILITGASGYIGSNLVRALQKFDCKITRVSRNSEKLAKAQDGHKLVNLTVDYEDSTAWDSLLGGVDIVFFLASQTSSYTANSNPIEDIRQNVVPLLNLLHSCETNNHSPIVIFSGTATQAGLTASVPVAEPTYDQPLTIYDIHKLSCEKYLSYYSDIDVLPSCCLRLSNVFGPGIKSSNADRGILNLMIQKAVNGDALTIYGDGENIRDYLYTDDVIAAFLAAASNIARACRKAVHL